VIDGEAGASDERSRPAEPLMLALMRNERCLCNIFRLLSGHANTTRTVHIQYTQGSDR